MPRYPWQPMYIPPCGFCEGILRPGSFKVARDTGIFTLRNTQVKRFVRANYKTANHWGKTLREKVTLRCPFLAAESKAFVVHPSRRVSCKNLTTSRWPSEAASSIARFDAAKSGRFTVSQCTVLRCPFAAAESTAEFDAPSHRLSFRKASTFNPESKNVCMV